MLHTSIWQKYIIPSDIPFYSPDGGRTKERSWKIDENIVNTNSCVNFDDARWEYTMWGYHM